MKFGKLIIAEKEYELLKNNISMAPTYRDKSYRASMEKIKNELALAKIVSGKDMPEDIIRFNSVVSIETPWNVKRDYQIVAPEKSDIKNNKISVLAPMGLALFGYAKGDEIEWQFPTGMNTIKIVNVVQFNTQVEILEV